MKRIVTITMMLLLSLVALQATTKTSIKVSDLSKTISDDISKNYPEYTVKEAFRVDTNGVISFEVRIQNVKDQWKLYYDKDGKFIKKVIVPPPAVKPAGKTKPKTDSHLVIKR